MPGQGVTAARRTARPGRLQPTAWGKLLAGLFLNRSASSLLCRNVSAHRAKQSLAARATGVADKVRLSPQPLICSQRCCQAGVGAKLENATRGIFLIAHHKQQVEAGSALALLWYLPAPGPRRSGASQPVPVRFSPAAAVPACRSPSPGRWVGAGGSLPGRRWVCAAFTMEGCC